MANNEQHSRFNRLQSDLLHQIIPGNKEHILLIFKHCLPPDLYEQKEMLPIFDCLTRTGAIGPLNLDLLKQAFPEYQDNHAFKLIEKAEREISSFSTGMLTLPYNTHNVVCICIVDKII